MQLQAQLYPATVLRLSLQRPDWGGNAQREMGICHAETASELVDSLVIRVPARGPVSTYPTASKNETLIFLRAMIWGILVAELGLNIPSFLMNCSRRGERREREGEEVLIYFTSLRRISLNNSLSIEKIILCTKDLKHLWKSYIPLDANRGFTS